jgi:zinc transporter 9
MSQQTDSSLKAVLAAVFSNILVTIAKFIGWSMSASPSMLAEAVHSLADTLNQLLLFIGIQHGAGKPSKMYPSGKGQARYIWNLVSATGIFFFGFGFTVYHGVSSLLTTSPENPSHFSWLSIWILAISFFAELYSLYVAFHSVNDSRGERGFWDYVRNGDDPTGVAVLLEDTIAVFGVLLALTGLWLSNLLQSPVPDAMASIFIGCLLGVMAIVLAIANGRILIGISAGGDYETAIRDFTESYPSVERIASLKTEVLSPGHLRVSIEVEFHGGILINRQQIEKDADRIRDGEDPAYILAETAERMVRVVGREINRLEADLHREFPEIALIDLVVN